MEQSIDSFGGVDAHNDYYEYEEMVSKGGVSILLLLLELVREWGASVGLRISVGRWSMIIIIFHPHHHRRLMHQKSHEVNAMTEDGGERRSERGERMLKEVVLCGGRAEKRNGDVTEIRTIQNDLRTHVFHQ